MADRLKFHSGSNFNISPLVSIKIHGRIIERDPNDKFSLADITGLSRIVGQPTLIYKSIFPPSSRNFPPVKRRRVSLRRLSPLKFQAGWRLWSLGDEQIFSRFARRVFLPRPTSSLFTCLQFHPRYTVFRRGKRYFRKEIVCLTTSHSSIHLLLSLSSRELCRVNYRFFRAIIFFHQWTRYNNEKKKYREESFIPHKCVFESLRSRLVFYAKRSKKEKFLSTDISYSGRF